MWLLNNPIHQGELGFVPRSLWDIVLSLVSTQVNLLVNFRQVCYAIRRFHLRRLLDLGVYAAIQLSLKRLLKYSLVCSCLRLSRTKGPSSISASIIIVGVTERITLLVLFDQHLLLVFDHLNGRLYMVKIKKLMILYICCFDVVEEDRHCYLFVVFKEGSFLDQLAQLQQQYSTKELASSYENLSCLNFQS